MEENMLKTSWKQRLFIALIAILLLGSTIAVYVAIVLGNDNVNYSRMTTSQLESAYEKAYAEYNQRATILAGQYLDEFKTYKSSVKAYNSSTANSNGVTSKDLKEGDGNVVENGKYSAYYIGYCSDETVFDSSFDSFDEPTTLSAPLSVDDGNLIEGWYLGVEGMKIGGVREITVPGPLAYGETYEICGGKNSPLKFIIYAIPRDEEIDKLSTRLNDIYAALSAAYTTDYSDYSEVDYSDYSDESTGE
ncbi:FKBP-type peptidyl-prolyl cis-trans isomerase [Candidatus Saccharibacteria bacterium]|nr:FKBP-type peptidyl-prolyl cis-trans isomerase [Candidatus Saccharibacteria bacterium]